MTIKWDNIRRKSKEDKLGPQESHNREYQYYKCDGIQRIQHGYILCQDLKVGYDYNSIMHYSRKLGRYDVIVPKEEGVTIGNRHQLSEKDVDGINEYYGCPKIGKTYIY